MHLIMPIWEMRFPTVNDIFLSATIIQIAVYIAITNFMLKRKFKFTVNNGNLINNLINKPEKCLAIRAFLCYDVYL